MPWCNPTRPIDDGTTGAVDGWEPFTAIAPKHLFKLWTDYRLSRWPLGGSVYATSHYGTVSDSGNLTQPGYVLFDARISWRATDQVTLAINGTNLGNHTYHQFVGGTTAKTSWVIHAASSALCM